MKMKVFSMKKEKLYRNLQTITVDEFFGYLNEIHGGYIRVQYHPEDSNLAILNYTELATFERRWNKYTMSARGLILDFTKVKNNGLIYILAKPFEKFFNFGEMPELEKDMNFNNISEVMEKMDGSLGISYFFNDEIRFATRGSFTSEQAIKATEMWRENYSHLYNDDPDFYINAPVTYLVEIIYPENQIVVDYGENEELVLIGMNHLFNDYQATYEDLYWEAGDLGMRVPKIYNYSFFELMQKKKEIDSNEEGWILRFDNDKRLKIKGDEYIQVHRIRHGLSDKAKVRAWADGDTDKYIMAIPEEFRPELEGFFKKLDVLAESIRLSLTGIFIHAKNNYLTNRKTFAKHVNEDIDKELRKFMFRALDSGEIDLKMVKDYIYDNYQEYLGVISQWNSQDF